jgi:NADH dehydrogenase
MNKLIAVTGAFGYSGSHIARLLTEAGHKVLTLTNSPKSNHPLANQIVVHPFNFDDPKQLVESLRSCSTLINTYWVRFDHKSFDHSTAVKNTLTLLSAASQAGIERIVHVSITNPEEGSQLPYFHGKGQLERAIRESKIPYTILRPAVLFGDGDILINNIAWALRRLPCFGVFGDGNYKIQPIHVDDFAALAVREALSTGDRTVEAIGPETFTYRQLAQTIGRIIGCSRPIFSVPPLLGYAVARSIGWIQNDEFVTREEIAGLMQNRLFVDAPPVGKIKLTDWAEANASILGRTYANELSRRTPSGQKNQSAKAVC